MQTAPMLPAVPNPSTEVHGTMEYALTLDAQRVLGMRLFDLDAPIPESTVAQILAEYRNMYLEAKRMHAAEPTTTTLRTMADMVDKMWSVLHDAVKTTAAITNADRTIRQHAKQQQMLAARIEYAQRQAVQRLPGLSNAMSKYDDE